MKNDPIPLILGRIFNTPLMIHEPKLDVILWALRDRLKITMIEPANAPENYKLSTAEKSTNRKSDLSIKEIAVIPVYDTLVHRHSELQAHSGMTSYLYVRNAFRAALANSDVSSILMVYDSPGGEASGVFDLADEIYNARGTKPIIAFINEIAFSAAYALASSADTIIVPRTGGIGSIGVIMRHTNLQKFNEAKGIEYTTLYAGARKNDFTSDASLSEEARAVAMNMINSSYELFASLVSRNRNLTVEYVKGTEAGMFWGENAVKAGLADQIGTIDDAIEHALTAATKPRSAKYKTKGMQPGKEGKMDSITSLTELVAAYPEYADQLREEGKNSIDVKETVDTAVSGERQRILGLSGIYFGAGVSEKFEKIVGSGVTVEQYRAVIPEGFVPAQDEKERAEAKIMGELLGKITTETGQHRPGMGGEQKQPQDFMALVEAYREENKCNRSKAISMIAKTYPEAHEEYLRSAQKGGK